MPFTYNEMHNKINLLKLENAELKEKNLELAALVGSAAQSKFGDWIIFPKIDGQFHVENIANGFTEFLPSYQEALIFVRDADKSLETPTVSQDSPETPVR